MHACFCVASPSDITAQLIKMYESGEINSKDTRCWAQGMEGWRPLREIPQLKWSGTCYMWCVASSLRGRTLVATGQGIMDLSSMATLCLNMLIRICAAYPSRSVVTAISTHTSSHTTTGTLRVPLCGRLHAANVRCASPMYCRISCR